jgi:hypothetical protein
VTTRISSVLLLACLLAGVGSVYGSPVASVWQTEVDVVFNATSHVVEAPSEVHSSSGLASLEGPLVTRHADATAGNSCSLQSKVCLRLYVLNQVFRL